MKVFTNGCFDLIHCGHIELLKYCREVAGLSGVVIVGINSDDSVKRLKSNNRPIFPAEDRIKVIRAIRYVDFVVEFDQDTPYELIKATQPDIIVKGGDYSPSDVVGNDLCEVRIFNYLDGYSTTEIIQRFSSG